MGPEGRAAAAESTRRLLRESGIAFNVYADPDDRAHAWRLDLVPVLLPDAEWERLAGRDPAARPADRRRAGRPARHAAAAAGRQPAGVAAPGQPGLRAHQRRPRGAGAALPLRLCLRRGAHRRRASGWSWATRPTPRSATAMSLASRVALSHGLAQLFRDCRTRRLAGYFLGVQESFQGLCRRDDGRIVILSPGPASPSYFSHAYLARYLGYTVVESGDLTVRDNQVYLKTLDGLQRVYLVVAKQPGHLMDPLHLPGSGLAGIPGLVQAARSGNVAMVNRPGSGVVQNHALAPFAEGAVPARCSARRRCWPTCRTRWLGEAGAAAAALARARALGADRGHRAQRPGRAVADARPRRRSAQPRAASSRSASPRRRIAGSRSSRCRSPPRPPSTASASCRRPYALRAFVVATESGYRILPGGMVRLAGAPDRRDPAQRLRQQGPVDHGATGRARGAQHPAHQHARGASAPHRPRPAQPHRRQSVLARPLRRARRGHHAAPAQRAVALPRGRPPRQQPGGPAAPAAAAAAARRADATRSRPTTRLGRGRGAGPHR